MRALLAFLALAACASIGDLPNGDDKGGSVLAYAARIAATRGPVEITGYCSSACGMWLGYEDVCIALPATLGFHAVRQDLTGDAVRIYERHLYDASPALLAWYRANAADSDEVISLSGSTLIRNGWAVACPT